MKTNCLVCKKPMDIPDNQPRFNWRCIECAKAQYPESPVVLKESDDGSVRATVYGIGIATLGSIFEWKDGK